MDMDPRYYMDNIIDLAHKNNIDDIVVLYNALFFFEDNMVNKICE